MKSVEIVFRLNMNNSMQTMSLFLAKLIVSITILNNQDLV